MKPKILLLNPPIYDFSAYDFWLKPIGLLQIGGYLKDNADMLFFDYLDREHPFYKDKKLKSEKYGKGSYFSQRITKPNLYKDIPRYYQRFGLPRKLFQAWLIEQKSIDFVLIESGMTYWYLGIEEVIEDIRNIHPKAKIVLGSIYATLCYEHAKELGVDLVIKGKELKPLSSFLGIPLNIQAIPLWEKYSKLKTAAIKITDGCPYSCTYCASKILSPKFAMLNLERKLDELRLLISLGVKDIAFYDDALLYAAQDILVPFLNEVLKRKYKVNFHTPNALHLKYLTPELAQLMVAAGFKTFCFGIENLSLDWHSKTGGKLKKTNLVSVVENLKRLGISSRNIVAYLIFGHPNYPLTELEKTITLLKKLNIKIFLSEYSPIPGTKDGDSCKGLVDLDNPLTHNKTAFTIWNLGYTKVSEIKKSIIYC
jgi:hypothetical protein